MSWGAGCAEKGFPGVYTRLSNFTDWVNATTKSVLSNSASAVSATGTGAISVSVSAGALSGVVGLSDLDPTVSQAGRPAGYTFPDGLASYQVVGLTDGASTTVTIRFPSGAPSGWKAYKATSAGFSDYSAHAVQNGDAIVLSLTDGGTGDSDKARNGVIVDPVGLAVPTSSGKTASSSSSSDGGGGGGGGGCVWLPAGGDGIELALLLLGGLALAIRKRQS